MANNADGTDGSGSPRLGRSVTSGKESGGYGHTASRSMPKSGTVSGKTSSDYGTQAARNTGGNANGADSNTDRSQISKTGWRR